MIDRIRDGVWGSVGVVTSFTSRSGVQDLQTVYYVHGGRRVLQLMDECSLSWVWRVNWTFQVSYGVISSQVVDVGPWVRVEFRRAGLGDG